MGSDSSARQFPPVLKLLGLTIEPSPGQTYKTTCEYDEELLGSADLQSLADLGNSYSVVSEMRLAPFGLKDNPWLIVIALLPFLPLTLTAFTPEQLVDQLLKILF
jgi:hypothetical protein